jgi:hypothetical protein
MRRYPVLLLAVALVLLTGLPADGPSTAVTVEVDTLTFDPASAAHVDHDSLLAAWPAEPWTRSLSGPTGDHPAAWASSRAVLVTVARAPPPVPSA